MHNVAFHVIPYGVVDNDHNTLFPNRERWGNAAESNFVSVQVREYMKIERDESSYFMISDLD